MHVVSAYRTVLCDPDCINAAIGYAGVHKQFVSVHSDAGNGQHGASSAQLQQKQGSACHTSFSLGYLAI